MHGMTLLGVKWLLTKAFFIAVLDDCCQARRRRKTSRRRQVQFSCLSCLILRAVAWAHMCGKRSSRAHMCGVHDPLSRMCVPRAHTRLQVYKSLNVSAQTNPTGTLVAIWMQAHRRLVKIQISMLPSGSMLPSVSRTGLFPICECVVQFSRDCLQVLLRRPCQHISSIVKSPKTSVPQSWPEEAQLQSQKYAI
jgi:hypothetical protein